MFLCVFSLLCSPFFVLFSHCFLLAICLFHYYNCSFCSYLLFSLSHVSLQFFFSFVHKFLFSLSPFLSTFLPHSRFPPFYQSPLSSPLILFPIYIILFCLLLFLSSLYPFFLPCYISCSHLYLSLYISMEEASQCCEACLISMFSLSSLEPVHNFLYSSSSSASSLLPALLLSSLNSLFRPFIVPFNLPLSHYLVLTLITLLSAPSVSKATAHEQTYEKKQH